MVATIQLPARSLLRHARLYYGFEERTASPMRRCEGPGTDVILLFSFGPEWRIDRAPEPTGAWEHRTSFVAGLRESSVLTEHDGHSIGMQVNLTPPGAYALFGIPMDQLADRTVDLADVLDVGRQLPEQLAALPTWSLRFQLLDAVLGARLDEARPASTCIEWAWGRLAQTNGRVSVDALAAELGWSRKRLAARFREQIGLLPKTAARMLRFEHAKGLLEQEKLDLAGIGHACGYFDQAHLSNDVRRITGMTPSIYRRYLRGETNLQDAARGPF
jgi:AraC-like DNA-binding protein